MEHCQQGAQASYRSWLALGASWLFCLATTLNAAVPAGHWRTDYDAALKEAQATQRPILATVTAVWCGACRQMQSLTLNEPTVAQFATDRFVTLAIDGDQRADLVSRYGITAFPTTFVLNEHGAVLHTWVGFQSSAGFLSELRAFAGKAPAVTDEFPAVSAMFPANASRFGFGAFCLSSLLDDNKLRRGVGSYVTEYRGVQLCFYSAEHRDRFLANPDRYWPVANGNCLVTSREHHQNAPGDPRVGVLWKNRLWFFADRDRQRQFMQAPDRFSNGL